MGINAVEAKCQADPHTLGPMAQEALPLGGVHRACATGVAKNPVDTRRRCVIFKSNMAKGLPMLRSIRERQGHSLRSLADQAGMSYVALFRLETGGTDPRLSTLEKLAKALKVSLADLIAGRPARKRAGRR